MYRFSGHETFPCRYAWLPKAFLALNENPKLFADEESAMVSLGVGKNMVRSIRFWVQTTGIAESDKKGGYAVTGFGKALLAHNGFDPFLEDIRTLWLLHWRLSTQVDEPLFAWDFLLNRWQHPEISRTEVLRAFNQETQHLDRKLSAVTLEQHFDTFLHTYVPTRGRKGDIQEDNLDCPLVELELIQEIGERRTEGTGKREPIYAFRRESKPEITAELFIFCLDDFWKRSRANEKTLTFRDLSVAHGSPGQVFKLPEWDLRDRLEALEADSGGAFRYRESSSLQQVIRKDSSDSNFLASIYASEDV
jgi:hypothetical protein